MAIPNKVCEDYDKQLGSATALDSHKLKQAEAIVKLSKALGGKLLHFYVYGAVEGDTLVVYLSHNAMIAEFECRRAEIILDMRKIYATEGMNKQLLNFSKIVAKVKHKPAPKKAKEHLTKDSSSGEFEIHAGGALAAKFRDIAKAIRENNERYEEQERGGT